MTDLQSQDTNKEPVELTEIIAESDISSRLDEEWLGEIAQKVVDDYEEDVASRKEWEQDVDRALDLVQLKEETKYFPWEGAANIKYPLMSSACFQFSARINKEIVRDDRVMEFAVLGVDEDGSKEQRAKRLTEFHSHKLLIDSDTWEDENEKLLTSLPVVGTAIKKVYWNGYSSQPESVFIPYKDIAIHSDVKSLESASRITHRMDLHRNDLVRNIRSGFYRDIDIDDLKEDPEQDLDDVHEILESHTFLDLDLDGYDEPYIVTVHKHSQKVLKIKPRFISQGITYNKKDQIAEIKPLNFFIDYHFLRDPAGGFWSLGYGILLLHPNTVLNSLLNQLVNAGTLSTTPAGFYDETLGLKGGKYKFKPGEYLPVSPSDTKLSDSFYDIKFPEPSPVLAQMVSVLLEGAKEISSINDILTGQEKAQNSPVTTVLTLLQQGLTIPNSIKKRLYRAYKKEFKHIYELNKIYLDRSEYIKKYNITEEQAEEDFDFEDFDIRPVANPTMSSEAERLSKVQHYMALAQDPRINGGEALKRAMEGLELKRIEDLMAPPPNPMESPEFIELQANMARDSEKLKIDQAKVQLEARKIELESARIMKLMDQIDADIDYKVALAVQAIAQAGATEQKTDIDRLKIIADSVAHEDELKAKTQGTGDNGLDQ